MKKCNGDRCPMQYPYDVDSCRLTDECPYYVLKVEPTEPKEQKNDATFGKAKNDNVD